MANTGTSTMTEITTMAANRHHASGAGFAAGCGPQLGFWCDGRLSDLFGGGACCPLDLAVEDCRHHHEDQRHHEGDGDSGAGLQVLEDAVGQHHQGGGGVDRATAGEQVNGRSR